jgi:hypothetical protein
VIVPVYNPGPVIEVLYASVKAQTIAGGARIVFVDDGSTDETTVRWLRSVAAKDPMAELERIPNSGWPGKPRNIGLRRSTTDYVFFSDQDDELYPVALEQMVQIADRNTSDVVFGKVVRVGAGTPYWSLAHRDIEDADVVRDGLAASRTVHKLFRREFLVGHDIAFPEGRVRLEDHHYMAQVLSARPRVAVLASVPCYRWVDRNDGTNTSAGRKSTTAYWGYYTEAMNLPASRGADPDVDDALRVAATAQAFSRTALKNFLAHRPQTQDEDFAATSAWVRDAVPARLDPELPVIKRVRVEALRLGDRLTYTRAQEWKATWRADEGRATIRPAGPGAIAVEVAATVTVAGARGPDGRWVVDGLDADYLDLLERSPDAVSAELSIRDRERWTEWPVESTFRATPTPGGFVVTVSAVVRPGSGTFGRPLEPGYWDVYLRVRALGEASTRRVPVGAALAAVRIPGATAYATKRQTLAVKVKAG